MRRPKPKTVSYEVIVPDGIVGQPMYALLRELVEAHHGELRYARIALAWCTSWKPDVDGRVILGKCRKASDLDRELAAFDFVILLRKFFWQDSRVTDHQRRALLDHELCHAARKYDSSGEPVEDERGRQVYRVRKHDIEEFTEIVQRYGCYKHDLERFAAALRGSVPAAFTACEACADTPGWVSVVVDGAARLGRCPCYQKWAEQRAELLAS
jgi:hypothetical protein